MYCSWCASAVFWTVCGFNTCLCTATGKHLLGLDGTAAHDLVNVDSLLSRPQGRPDCCCRQRRSDRLFLRGSDVSEVCLVLASHVLHGGMRDLVLHCLAAKLLIWTLFAIGLFLSRVHRRAGPALFSSAVGPLFSPAVGPLFSLWCSSKLLGLLFVFDCLSRRARRSRWQTVRLLRVVFWTDLYHCSRDTVAESCFLSFWSTE